MRLRHHPARRSGAPAAGFAFGVACTLLVLIIREKQRCALKAVCT